MVHYLAQNPDFIGSFFMGFSIALGLSFWSSAKQGCLIGALYVYVFGAWFLIVCVFLLAGQTTGKEGFFFGFTLFHTKTVFSWVSSAFFWMIEKNRQWKEAEDQAKEEKEWKQSQQHQQGQTQNQQRAREEQARREQEAREYRQRQEQAKQEQARKQNGQQHQQEQKREAPPRKPEPTRDTRTFAEILGLSVGYSQDDLKTAYKRECQRLHPDKWSGKPASIQAIMEAEYKAVQEAYKRLKT